MSATNEPEEETMTERPRTSSTRRSVVRGGLIRRPEGRPLPVVVLADVSGSMGGDKISSLNEALRQMVESFAAIDGSRGSVWTSVITFHDRAELVLPPAPASTLAAGGGLPGLRAGGMTAMGAAFSVVRELLEDREAIPRGAWLPTLVLLSDGQPNDTWEPPLQELLSAPRASKAMRLAMAIGADADVDMLRRFVGHPEIPVVRARDASRIASFFRFVTFTVTQRSVSINPNAVGPALLPAPHTVDLDVDDLIY